jgi:hypothetical protein
MQLMSGRTDTIVEMMNFLAKRKKFILIPMMMALMVMGLALLLSNGSAIAPFIYTLF